MTRFISTDIKILVQPVAVPAPESNVPRKNPLPDRAEHNRDKTDSRKRGQKILPSLLGSQLPVNIHRKLCKEIRQNRPPRLAEGGPSAFRNRIARLREPGRRNHAPAKCTAILRPLRTHLLLAPVIRHK